MRAVVVWVVGVLAVWMAFQSLGSWFGWTVAGESGRVSLPALRPSVGVVMIVCIGLVAAVAGVLRSLPDPQAQRHPMTQTNPDELARRARLAMFRAVLRAVGLGLVMIAFVCFLVLVLTVRAKERATLSGAWLQDCLGRSNLDCDLYNAGGQGGAFAALALALAGFCLMLGLVRGRMAWPLAWWATTISSLLSIPVDYWVVTEDGVQPNSGVLMTGALFLVVFVVGGVPWTVAVWARWRWPFHLLATIVPTLVVLTVAGVIAESGTPYYERVQPGVYYADAVQIPDFGAIPSMFLPIVLGVVTAVAARRERRSARG